jgi:hypothetical protein
MYPKILNFYPVTVQSFSMSMPRHRECVLPLVWEIKTQSVGLNLADTKISIHVILCLRTNCVGKS